MKAAVLTEFNRPLRIVELPRPEPGSCEVVVKVEASGICHTDIHTARGEWAAHDAVLPRVLGHEAVGIVVRRGEGVTSLKDGDRVAVPWLALRLRGTAGSARADGRPSASASRTPG